jgi:hypothetical protein
MVRSPGPGPTGFGLDGGVRHEVAQVAVASVDTGRNLVFCHQYPTRACVAGNGKVRSLWDNAASIPMDWS